MRSATFFHVLIRSAGLGVTWTFLAGVAVGQVAEPVTDAQTGQPVMYPSYITEYAGALYFRGSTAPHATDPELWRCNGQSAERVADIIPGATGSSPACLCAYNGKLYFTATGPTGGTKLWQYDPAGGAQLAPGSAAQASLPEELTVYNGQLYYRATRYGAPSSIGTELWRFDGTNQTPIDIFAGSGNSYPQHFTLYNGMLYFNACGTPGQGTELWRYSGSGMPTEAARIYPDNGSSPEQMAVYNGSLYFSAYDGVHGRELWRYDGTQASLAADIVPGGAYSSSNPNNLIVYRDKLYFSATDGVHGYELWRFDGAQAQMVAEINPTPDPGNGDTWMMDSSPMHFVVFNDVLYFSADDGVHGRELWSYDGENASLVLDINPGPYGSEVSELTVFNGRLYFSADSGYVPGLYGLEPIVWSLRLPTPPPVLQYAVSKKQHADLGLLGIGLTLSGEAASEDRSGGPTLIVLKYDRPIALIPPPSVAVTNAALVDVSPSGDELSVSLTGAIDETCVAIAVRGVASAADPSAVAPPHVVRVRARLGDLTSDGRVQGPAGLQPGDPGFETSDVSQLQYYGLTPPGMSVAPWCDLNCSGSFDSMDAILLKAALDSDVVACQSEDADGDGVDDLVDSCPATIPDAGVDGDGCPALIPGDSNRDGDVDSADLEAFVGCISGPGVHWREECRTADLDGDTDVDQDDFGVIQRCFSGANRPVSMGCEG